jgi:hypothetical protein
LAPITDKTRVVIATPHSSNATAVSRCRSAADVKLAIKTAAITAYRL